MKKLFITLLTVVALLATPFVLVRSNTEVVQAASLTDIEVALTNEAVSATDNIVVTFTPNTAITNGTIIEVSYDTNFTGGAALTDADVAVTGTNISSSTESDFAAGYFRSTLVTGGSVTTTVTITIDGTNELTNPATEGNYNWSLSVDIGGAGTTFDSGAGLAYVGNENDVTVSAFVPSIIDLEIYEAGVDALLNGTGANTCELGVLSINTVSSCNYDIGTGTNNSAGLTVQLTSDGDLDDGSANTINACSGTNCDSDGTAGVTAGSEEYGIQITELGGGEYTAAGSFGTADQAIPTTATTFATTSSTGSGTNSGQVAQRMEVTHRASVDTATVVGSYDQVVTYTAFTN